MSEIDYLYHNGAMLFVLPLPVSLNNLYGCGKNHHMYKKNEAKVYQDVVRLHLNQYDIPTFNCEVAITLKIYLAKGDIDNFKKLLFDTLNGYAYRDDELIMHEEVYKFYDKTNPRIEMVVKRWHGKAPRLLDLLGL